MTEPVDKILSQPASRWLKPVLIALALVVFTAAAPAPNDDSVRHKLEACLKKADQLPDIAAAEAEAWLKQGGGEAAILCRAFASFHSGAFPQAAEDFGHLAANRADSKRAALLHAQAGLAWMRAANYKKSEEEYGKALKLEPQDPDIWVDRATERGANQRYWDAIGDLNEALKIMPDMSEALRLRGDVWFKLGNGKKAEDDFRQAAEIDAEDAAVSAKTASPAKKP